MINFSCACGQPFSVREENAGRRTQCPRCKQPVVVPPAGAPPTPHLAATPQAMPRPGARPGPGPGMAPFQQPYAPNPGTAPPYQNAGTAPGFQPGGMPGRAGSAPPPPPSSRGGPPPSSRPAARTAPRLLVMNGPSGFPGRAFGLSPGKPTVIGRDPAADVPIPSERISRRHCQLEPTPDGLFVLVDLGSSNGTLVNQERIAGRKVLMGGEYIQAGDVLLRFE